jgi:hypothetical protein
LVTVTTLSLAAIAVTFEVLRPAANSELLFHPRLLLTTLFAPALVPLAASAWLVFASRWRWAAALMVGLALATPPLLIHAGIGEILELETPQLWVVFWVNLSATVWAAASMLLLRWCGLRQVA